MTTLVEETRVCSTCGEERLITDFHKCSSRSETQRRQRTCKFCRNAKLRDRHRDGVKRCTIEECDRPFLARGLCNYHYSRWSRGLPVIPGRDHPLDGEERRRPHCSVEGCSRPGTIRSGGLCDAHHQRLKKHGSTRPERPLIVRTGTYIDQDGYVVQRANGHPNGTKNGSIFEHQTVMVEKIGRPLLSGETVHHKNGVRDDNRPENLELWAAPHPRGARVADLIIWAREIIDVYGEDETIWFSS